jgi:hypothetical protein
MDRTVDFEALVWGMGDAVIGAGRGRRDPSVEPGGLMKHPLTDSGLSKFLNDWNKSGAEILSYSRAAESSHRERSSPTGTCYVANASGDWHLTSTAIQKEGRYGCS